MVSLKSVLIKIPYEITTRSIFDLFFYICLFRGAEMEKKEF